MKTVAVVKAEPVSCNTKMGSPISRTQSPTLGQHYGAGEPCNPGRRTAASTSAPFGRASRCSGFAGLGR